MHAYQIMGTDKHVSVCQIMPQLIAAAGASLPSARPFHKVIRRLYQRLIAGLIEEGNGDSGAAGICIDDSVWCWLVQAIGPHLQPASVKLAQAVIIKLWSPAGEQFMVLVVFAQRLMCI